MAKSKIGEEIFDELSSEVMREGEISAGSLKAYRRANLVRAKLLPNGFFVYARGTGQLVRKLKAERVAKRGNRNNHPSSASVA